MNYLKILLIYRRFDLLDTFIKLSKDLETKNFEDFKAIKPIRKNFDKVNRLNKLITIIFRFFGVNYKSHIIY